MANDNLDNIAANLDGDAAVEERVKAKVRQAKSVETLDEAYQRITALKLDDRERRIVDDVFALWRTSRQSRPEGRLSKKACFAAWEAWLASERERKKAKVLASRKPNCWIVTNAVQLASLEMALMFEDVITLDTETTGLDVFNDRIVGIAGTLPKSDIDFYVPFGHIDPSDKEAFVELGKREGFDAAIEKYRLPSQLPKDDVMAFYVKALKRRHGWHNFDYDSLITMNEDIVPDPPYWDTLKAMKLLNEHEPSYKLKDLHAKYVSHDESITFEDLFDDQTIFDKPIDLVGIYAAGDGRKTYDLMMFEKRYIDTIDNLRTAWYDIDQKLLFIDPIAEREGVSIDLSWLDALREEFTPRVEQAKRDVIAAFGLSVDFDFNSWQQMQYLIYDVAGADPKFPLKFKKKERSTDAKVVEALCEELPQLKPLRTYRQLEKLLGTYVNKIPKAIEPATGKLHYSLDSQGTETGRYSSFEYCSAKNSRTGDTAKGTNVQNIPSKTEEGQRVRMAFVPSPGRLFVSSDLSQIEPRVIAHILKSMFNDDSMARIYEAGVDLYTTMATMVFALDEQYCLDGAYDPTHTFKPRKLMKEGVLAYLYGQSPAAFARRMGVGADVAANFFERMTASFPGLQPFKAWVYDSLAHRGKIAFSETLWGRKRRYPAYREELAELTRIEQRCYRDGLEVYRQGGPKGRSDEEREEIAQRIERLKRDALTEEDVEAITRIGLYFRNGDKKERFWQLRKSVSEVRRQAVNHVIQGSAADILKQIVIRLFWTCWERRERGWRFLFSVHDEVFTEIPKVDVTEATLDLIDDIMTKTVTLSVPLKCDTVVSPRWMQEYRRHEWDFSACAPKAKEVA